MRKAALDIGTNSTRLLIAEKDSKDNSYRIILQSSAITRIGEGMKDDKTIKDQPLARTIEALLDYRRILADYQVSDYRLVATSAMRDALNQEQVLERIKKETGFDVQVISGSLEAELSYRGAVADFSGQQVIIDIGGGSTEVIFEKDGQIHFTSTNLGAVRLMDDQSLYLKMEELFAENIPDHRIITESELVGVGGTITTLAAVKLKMEKYDWEKIHGFILTRSDIEEISQNLNCLSLEDRKKVPGLQPERADIILFGVDILRKFMDIYCIPEIKVSDKDLLFALLLE